MSALPCLRAVARWPQFALLLVVLVARQASAEAPERWYELRIAGIPSGYEHERVEPADAGLVRTVSETEMVINRLGARVEISVHATETERGDGTLARLHFEMRTSKDATVLDVEVNGDTLTIVTEAGGRSYRQVEPATHVLLGPEGVRAETLRALAAGEPSFEYATFVPELGRVAVIRREILERQSAADGPAARSTISEGIDLLGAPARMVLDADGQLLEESQPGPFGEITLRRSTEAVRDAQSRDAPLPDELFTRSLVPSNVRLPEPRAIDELKVRIDLKNPETGFPELEGPGQRVLERARDHIVLAVRRPSVAAKPGPDAPPGAPFTEANVILQADHPDVVALAASLRRPGAGAYAQARALQDWVAEHMRFDAGLAVVPASEVVRDRGGTCVAYAVLLTSLARALGIPARVVMGYAYVENIWGGHAWSEIRVGERWVPLDATLYAPGPADAARIAIVHHSAEQGAASGAVDIMRLFGNESIRVLAYRRGNDWVEVPDGAPPYRIDGDRYDNPWLGLRLTKPPSFKFTDADARFPDPTVIALAAPDGGEISVRQLGAQRTSLEPEVALRHGGFHSATRAAQIAGRAALRATGPAGEALAFRKGADVWLLSANPGDALRALDEVARSFVLAPSPAARRAAVAAR